MTARMSVEFASVAETFLTHGALERTLALNHGNFQEKSGNVFVVYHVTIVAMEMGC